MKIIEDSEKVHDSEIKCQALELEPRSSESPKPHISAARPQPCDTQWTFILHGLTPRIQGWLQLPFLYPGFVFSYHSSSLRILSYYWRQDGRRALSCLGGASLGYFQCLFLMRSPLPEQKHFLYPASSQTTCRLEPQSLTNPCACSYISGSQLGRWCSPSVWRHFSWSKIAGGE